MFSQLNTITYTNLTGGTLTNQQIYIPLTRKNAIGGDAIDFAKFTSSTGADHAVTLNGSAVPSRIMNFSASAETADLYLNVASLPTGVSTFTIQYGDYNTTSQPTSFDSMFVKASAIASAIANVQNIWQLENTSGTTVTDSVGSATLTLVNAPTWTAGAAGGWNGTQTTFASSHYLSFVSASSQYATTTALNALQVWSVGFWLYIHTSPTDGQRYFAKIGQANQDIDLSYTSASGGNLMLTLYPGGGTTTQLMPLNMMAGTGADPIGRWVHIGISNDPINNQRVRLYVDGLLQCEGASTNDVSGSSKPAIFGGYNFGSPGNFADCFISEIAVIAAEATMEQMLALAQRRKPVTGVIYEWEKWTSMSRVLPSTSAEGGASGATQEPTLMKVGSLYYLFYTGAFTDTTENLNLATSPDLVTWTKQGSIIGKNSVESKTACRSGFCYNLEPSTHPGRMYAFYAHAKDDGSEGTGISLSYSDDCIANLGVGSTWSVPTVVMALTNVNFGQKYENVWVYPEKDGTFTMIADTTAAAGYTGEWGLMEVNSASAVSYDDTKGYGNFTNLRTFASYSGLGVGMSGSPAMGQLASGQYALWCHTSPTGSGVTNVYSFVSSDKKNWTRPVTAFDSRNVPTVPYVIGLLTNVSQYVDQSADMSVLPDGAGNLLGAFCQVNNANAYGYVHVLKSTNTMDQYFAQVLTAQVGSAPVGVIPSSGSSSYVNAFSSGLTAGQVIYVRLVRPAPGFTDSWSPSEIPVTADGTGLVSGLNWFVGAIYEARSASGLPRSYAITDSSPNPFEFSVN